MRQFAMLLAILLALPAGARAGARQAAEKVREGIAQFRAKDYDRAAKTFAEADLARPDDPWIAFDRACAYAAGGQADKATKLFEQAAMSRDRSLAVRSRYNLGVMAAEKARALFGDKPEEASAEVRAEGLALLTEAVKHYRDCLDLDESHADARHNLELIRLWIKHMQELWRERDRQKERKEKGLLEFLLMIEARERELRSDTKSLAGQPDSPERRQALVTAESSQRKLAEEIGPLDEKIKAELGSAAQTPQSPQQPSGSPPRPAVSPEAAKKAVQALTKLADEAGKAMVSAADDLKGGSPADAKGPQTEAVEKLDQIYRAVVPFPDLVQRSVATEQGLVDQVAPAAENPGQKDLPDLDEPAWNQRLLAGWADELAPKAEQGLKGLENVDPSTFVAASQGRSQPAGPGAQAKPDAEAMKKRLEGLKQSMEKAVELGPKVHDLANEAAEQLAGKKPAEALPKQEEALKLLKQIAEPLPKQNQEQQPQQQQKQNQDQRGDQKQNQQKSSQDQKQDSRQPQDLSKRQAEAVLRKVRQRQRDRREQEKQIERQIYRPGAVEKDW